MYVELLDNVKLVKDFIKKFGKIDIIESYIGIKETKLTFYILGSQYLTQFSVEISNPEKVDIFISTNLSAFVKSLSKCGDKAKIEFDEYNFQLIVQNDKSKIKVLYNKMGLNKQQDIESKVEKMIELKASDTLKLTISQELLDKLNKIEKIEKVSTVDYGCISLNKGLRYLNKLFIYMPTLDYIGVEEDCYLTVPFIQLLTYMHDFGAEEINISKTSKFITYKSNNFKIIATQKRINFEYPSMEELQNVSPIKKEEGWTYKFNSIELLQVFEEFRDIFMENNYRWEPIYFTFTKNSKQVKLSYKDIFTEKESIIEAIDTDYTSCYDFDDKVEEYTMEISSQLLSLFLNDSSIQDLNVCLTFRPQEKYTDSQGCIGILVSLENQDNSLNETAILQKMED